MFGQIENRKVGTGSFYRRSHERSTKACFRSVEVALVCGLPLINCCYVVAFWLLASAVHGEWVQPGVNDPKGFFMGIPFALEVLLMMLSFSVAPFVIYLGVKRDNIAIYFFCYLVSFLLGIVLFRLDLWQITAWIAD
ncbi:hypothetical protein OAH23_12420 [Verrucomicrobia bacterium]|nr:hypothetical protein [Verrucomicrobiota bacterium]MDB4691211.1 hypothetical protein [Verrucomicrobiota bacterium]